MAVMWLTGLVLIGTIYLIAVLLPSGVALRTGLKIVWFLVAAVTVLSLLPSATEDVVMGAFVAAVAALIFTWGTGFRAATLALGWGSVPTVLVCLLGLLSLPLPIWAALQAGEWWHR